MTPSERFGLMLAAMVGEMESQVAYPYRTSLDYDEEEHHPDEWGLDDDDEAEARTDYADVWN